MSKIFTDEEMIDAIKAGGTQLDEVMDFIYHRSGYRKSILNYIGQRNGNQADAEDIFQDGICHMIINIRKGQFQRKSSLRTYLTTICKNLWFTKFSRIAKHIEIVQHLNDEDEIATSPENIAIHRERTQNLENILSQLGEKCKNILSLWSLSYSMKEITQVIGYKSEGMTRKKKHQCFQKLMILVKEQPALVQELIGKL